MTQKQRFGFVFGETFVEPKRRERFLFARTLSFYLLGLGLLLVILGRLVQLQVIHGAENRQRSESNRLSVQRLSAPRGVIFDRNGEALTRNVPLFKWLGEDGPVKLGNGVNKWQIVSKEEAQRRQEEGGEIWQDVGREYLFAGALAHVVGYVGEISEAELAQKQLKCNPGNISCNYVLGDTVGKMGLERVAEESLRGEMGGVVVERGANGEMVRQLTIREPIAGEDIRLSIDAGLSQKAIEVLAGREGAVIASDPKTGEILALVSSPSFDPNLFSNQQSVISNQQREEILTSEEKPLFNRALGGLYAPGSVFKVVTATAGLEEEKIDEKSEIEDTGEITVGTFRYGNWYFDQYGRKEGSLNIVSAIKRSNDIFFYRVGERLGAEKLAEWAGRFGLGKVVAMGLPGEAQGMVPSPEWKERVLGERWFLGNTYHFAIGQGDLQVTPIQIHQMASVVARLGKKCPLSLVTKKDEKALISPLAEATDCEDLGIEPETIKLVTEGMVAACAPGGTAFPFFTFSAKEASPSGEIAAEDRAACKTGTAEFGDPQDRTHAWFVVFAPAEDPELVMTVLLEKAGEGSYEAAPVARALFDYWFHERK